MKAWPLYVTSRVPPRGRRLAVAICLLAGGLARTSSTEAGAPPVRLRPPAVPLVTHDPYFSIWSPDDRLADADTVHWTGKPHRLTSLVRIDGKAFRVMGKTPANVPVLPQTCLEVLPTRTIYTFEGAGVRLMLVFMTPTLPDDLMVCSRPATYVTWELLATDGRRRAVEIYFEASPEIAVNEPQQAVTWSQADQAGLHILRVGSADQPVLQRKGDDLRIDWGSLYVATRTKASAAAAFTAPAGARETFVAKGGLVCDDRSAVAPAAGSEAPAAILTFDRAEAGGVRGRCWLMLAYDDEFSIKYFKQNLRPYWRRNGDDAAALLKKAAADYESLKHRCEQFDEQLMSDLRKVGGEQYAQLCALAYRQTFAGNKIVADAKGQPLMFPKENFSNGCIGTVDVLFPQAPFFLVFSPALTKAMIVPILDYAASPRWPYAYAPHDLGTYPHATGQVYGMDGKDGDRMPVEESGNMLIMLAALAKQEGNADLAKPYWAMLTQWADYLVKEGLDPQNQLCSADMFGHLPRGANLALKAIVGIGGYAQLCDRVGKPDGAKRYLAIARDYAAKWQELAKDDGRTRLAYHLPGTWGMKHNLIWDRVLGTKLFPDSVGDNEVAWYLKVQEKYGLPVDNRTDTSLIDWALWSIALARSDRDFQSLLAPLFRYANETPSRVPLSDWFVTTDAKQKGFQARPVVGGLFIKMLADKPTWRKWARQGANASGTWSPIPIAPPGKETVPTARLEPVMWHYTLDQPADHWCTSSFDDSAWKEGPAGFGTQGTPGAVIRTEWRTKRIWLRREFALPDRLLKNPRLVLIYDEDPEVYLNGVLAAKLTGWTTEYDEADISAAAMSTLKPGKNLLAVRASQTYGGQCIDVGLAEDGITLSDGWTRYAGEGPLKDRLHYANTADAIATWAFQGTTATLIHKTGPDCGIAGVLIDGQPGPTPEFNTFSPTVEWNQRTVLANDLPDGRHVVTVEPTGKRNAQSSNAYVQIVAFETAHPLLIRKLMDTPLRDTSICRGPDGTWYLTGTVEPFWAYNEGIKLWRSKDLVDWEALGFVWKYGASPWHKPYLEKKKPLWAPEVHYLKGTFWLTYSIPGWDGTGKTSGCGLLKSFTGKPEGPYEDVQPGERLGDEIDASLFQDDDGAVYFLWHSGKIARMKSDMSGLAEQPYHWLRTATSDPNPKHHSGLCAGIFGKDSFDHVGYEGMFMFKVNGRYILACSDECEGRYSCYIATSTSLYGPYSQRYEAIPHGGHNMFFQDGQGQWWSTYFGSDDSAPWRERPGILPVRIDQTSRIEPEFWPETSK